MSARVGNFRDVESVTLVADANLEPVRESLAPQPNALIGVVLVAMPDGIDHRFVHGHFDFVLYLLAKSCRADDLSHDLVRRLNILEIALERHFHNSGFRSHKRRIAPSASFKKITSGVQECQ